MARSPARDMPKACSRAAHPNRRKIAAMLVALVGLGLGNDGASAVIGARLRRLACRAARGRGRDRGAALGCSRMDARDAWGRDLPRRRGAGARLQPRDAASARRERHPGRPVLHVDAGRARRRRRLAAQAAPRRNPRDQPGPALAALQHAARQRRPQGHGVRHPRRRRRAALRGRCSRRPSRSHECSGPYRRAERLRRHRACRRDADRLRDRRTDRLDALGHVLSRDNRRPPTRSRRRTARLARERPCVARVARRVAPRAWRSRSGRSGSRSSRDAVDPATRSCSRSVQPRRSAAATSPPRATVRTPRPRRRPARRPH